MPYLASINVGRFDFRDYTRSGVHYWDAMDPALGALVDPGGNALRCVVGAAPEPGERLLVLGTGTIGLLVAMFARARGAEVHLIGRDPADLALPRSLGFGDSWTRDTLPGLPWDAVVDASTGAEMPPFALDRVEPGRRVVYIGLAWLTAEERRIVCTGQQGADGGLIKDRRPAARLLLRRTR